MEKWDGFITRSQLYKEVWSEPLTRLEKKFDLKSSKIRSVCKELNIPLPEVGYWEKKRSGKEVKEIELPPADNSDEQFNFRYFKEEYLDNEKILELLENEKNPKNKIIVPQSLHAPHILTKFFMTGEKINAPWFRPNAGRINLVSATKQTEKRAFRILDTIIKASEKRNFLNFERFNFFHVPIISILGEFISFKIREKHIRIKNDSIRSIYPETILKPTGKLIIEADFKGGYRIKNTWMDDEIMIEDILNDFMISCIKHAAYEVDQDEKNRIRNLELERQKQILELERKRELREKEKELFLFSQSKLYKNISQIKEYIDEIERTYLLNPASNMNAEEVNAWLAWARATMNKSNPVINFSLDDYKNEFE